MKNDKLKCKPLFSTLPLFIVSLFFVFACDNGFEPAETQVPSIETDTAESGYGKVRVSFTEDEAAPSMAAPNMAARTVLPSKEFDKYIYTFTKSGEEAGTELTPDEDGLFSIGIGTYTVAVQAFTGSADSYALMASGVSSSFTVDPNTTSVVKVTLSATSASTEGTFRYTITWPLDAEGTITLLQWPDIETLILPSGTLALPLDAGSYLLTVLIHKNNLYAGVSEAIHILPSITTEYIKNFEESDLLLTQWLVSYDINGATSGTTPASQSIGDGSSITLPGQGGLAKTDYFFGGWNTMPDGSGTNYGANTSYKPTGNITLYAKWNVAYTVTYDRNGGSGTLPSAQKINPGESVTVPSGSALSMIGYTFGGWNTLANGTGTNYAAGSFCTPESSITLYANWTSIVTFNSNGGTGTVAAQAVPLGSGTTLPDGSGISRTGFVFGGWNNNAAGTGTHYNAGDTYVPIGNSTLYARWDRAVTFDSNGGAGTVPASQTLSPGASMTLPAGSGLSKDGYAFGGWVANANGTGTLYAAGSSYSPTTSITLYARWDYTVTFNSNGGTGTVAPQTALPGTSTTLPGQGGLYKANYYFDGWNTNAEGTGTNYSTSYTVTGNVTLYAKWLPGKTVTFNANGGAGTVPNSQTTAQGRTITLPSGSGLSQEGYVFGGWNTNANGNGTNYAAGASYTVNDDVTLYARWLFAYKVTFNANEGTGDAPSAQTAAINTSITLPSGSGLSREGYLFGGWNTLANGTGTNYAAGASYTSTVSGNFTLYAKWNPTYTVTYSLNNGTGTTPSPQTAISGEVITLPSGSGFSRTNYVFDGWSTNAGGTGTNYTSGSLYTMGSANVILYAKWVSVYTVSYNLNYGDGIFPSSQTVTIGSSVTLADSANIYRSGCTFDGWNTLANGTGTTYAAGSSYTPTGSITLYARWTSTVTFDNNSGSGTVAAQTVVVGANTTLPSGSALSKSGYLFGGWNTRADGNGVTYAVGASYTVNAHTTLYAKWNTAYTVTFNVNGGSGTVAAQTVAAGSGITLPGGPSRSGYVFDAWNAVADGTGTNYSAGTSYTPTGNVTLYARWYIPLTANEWSNGNIAAGSYQWFKFTATTANQYIHFEPGTLNDVNVQVYTSANATQGGQTNLYGTTLYAGRELTRGSTYYVKVTPYYANGSGAYRLGLTGSFKSPSVTFIDGSAVNGNLSANGEQWFRWNTGGDYSTQRFNFLYLDGGISGIVIQVYDHTGTAVWGPQTLQGNGGIGSTASHSFSSSSRTEFCIKVTPYNGGSGAYKINAGPSPL